MTASDEMTVPRNVGPGEMMAPGISRRSFMRALGLTSAAAASAPLLSATLGASAAEAKTGLTATRVASGAAASVAPSASADGILVMLTLYGGNDGLNTVVPYSDVAYQSARAELALRDGGVLPLDSSFALNSSLTRIKGLWDERKVAIIQGVGYPNPNRSHFRSMDIWQTARPEEFTNTGWLGRWHDATGPDPLRMVNLGTSLPRFMSGIKGSGAAINPGKLALPGGASGEATLTELGRGSGNQALGPLGARIAASNADLVRAKTTFAPILNVSQAAGGGGSTNLEGGGAAGGEYVSGLTRDLQEVSLLIRAGAPTRVYGVALGGFDTHAAERDQHARLLSYVDQAVSSFYNEISKSPNGQRVTVVIYSEFGRRVSANGSNGTDHGTAAPVIVVGPQVKGGFYGQPPSLTDLDQGDLKFTTDFRSVYATVLGQTLGIDPAAALGKSFPTLGFL